VSPGVPESLGDLGEQRFAPPPRHRGREPHGEHHADRHRVADHVDGEDAAEPDGGHQAHGDQGYQQLRHATGELHHAGGVAEVALGDELGDGRRVGQALERERDGQADQQRVDVPDLELPGPQQQAEYQLGGSGRDVAGQHHRPPRAAVDHGTSERGDHHAGYQADDREEGEAGQRAGGQVDPDRDGELGQRRTGDGDQLPGGHREEAAHARLRSGRRHRGR
jgi:hypothetical protein